MPGTESAAPPPDPIGPETRPPAGRRVGLWILMALVFSWISVALVYPVVTKAQLSDPRFGGWEADVGHYVRMYEGRPLAEIPRPFRYRVLAPFLARLVPEPPHALLRYFDLSPEKLVKYDFAVVNLVALALAGLLMVGLGEALGLSLGEAVLGALLFYTSFHVVLWGGTPMVDAWSWTLLLLGVVAALRGSLTWLFVASLLGMLAKETTLLLVPAVLMLAGPPRRKLLQLAALAPGVIAYFVFRLVLAPGGYGAPGDPANALSNLAQRLSQGPYLLWILFDGGTAFGLLWVPALIGWWGLRGSRRPLARLAWLVPFILLVPFAIGSNIGRIWFYAFPVVIPLAVVGLRGVLREGGVSPVASRGA